MKNFFSSKIFLALFFFLAGAACDYVITNVAHKTKNQTDVSNLNVNPEDTVLSDDDLLISENQSVGVDSISQREDAHYIYYDINVPQSKPDQVRVQVQDGQISISGKIESTVESESTKGYYSSHFQRSFAVPENVDSENYQMDHEDNKIVLKFPKVDRV